MNPIDYIILAIVAAILGGAIYFIRREKKNGAKCIGCPDSKTCSGNCSSCSACRHSQQ